MTIDINPIIAGNARFYYANSEEPEPILRRPFRKAVTATFTISLVASARATRAATGSTILDSSVAAINPGNAAGGSGTVDLSISSSPALSIGKLEWKPWQSSPLVITRAGSTGSFTTQAAASGALNGKSLYLTANNETVELPVSDATTTASTIMWGWPDDEDDRRLLGFILDLAVGDHLDIRIDNPGRIGGVDGSHARWTELGSNLVMETGVNVALNQTNDFLRVLSDQLPVEQFTTQENFTVSATIYDVSPEALAFLQNRKPVTTEAAVAGDRPGSRVADLERGPRPEKASLAIRMDSTPFLEVGGESQWWFPRVTITSNTTFPIQKTASQVPVQFTVLRSNLYEAAVRFRCQEGEFTV